MHPPPLWKAKTDLRMLREWMVLNPDKIDRFVRICYANAVTDYRQAKARAEAKRVILEPPPLVHAPPPEPPIESPYYDADEAAAYCKVKKKTIYNHRAKIERVPGIGKLIFTREALDKWLTTRPKRRPMKK